jgi:hypothetical protein
MQTTVFLPGVPTVFDLAVPSPVAPQAVQMRAELLITDRQGVVLWSTDPSPVLLTSDGSGAPAVASVVVPAADSTAIASLLLRGAGSWRLVVQRKRPCGGSILAHGSAVSGAPWGSSSNYPVLAGCVPCGRTDAA